MESFINCSNFWVENMDLFKTNGAIKLFLGKTCIIATAFGPFQSNYSRDYKRGTIEVNIKSIKDKDLKIQKYLEFSIANSLEGLILLENYPGTLIKLNLAILSEDGSLFSSLFNSAMLVLLKNGISLKTTFFAYTIVIKKKQEFERIVYFPNREEENKSDNKLELVLDLFNNEIQHITNQKPLDSVSLNQILSDCEKENKNFVDKIKFFLSF